MARAIDGVNGAKTMDGHWMSRCDNWDSNPDLEHGKLEFYP